MVGRPLVALALLCAAASAWTAPKLACVVNSAPGPNGSVTVHADVLGPFPYDDMSAWLYYSTDNQASWTHVPMTAVGRAGYDSTFAATFPLPASGTVYYYVQSSDGWGWATQTPVNSGNAWPVPGNLRAPIAEEPAGDAINNPDGPFLDLTDIQMSRSATHFYVRMTNNDDEWPIRRGILGPWYLYAAGFRNPDAAQDTWSFAMAYGNILGIYEPGLYEINAYTFDFEKFAEIDYRTDGNVLEMRCAITDLVANPKFGPWPIPSGFLRAARGDTRMVDISQNNTLHDTTNQSRCYIDRTPRFSVGTNSAPLLTQPRVVPDSGTPETDFWFSVRYSDADSNLALTHDVVVDDDTFELEPNHHRYWVGVLFDHTRSGFGPGWHSYRFVADDGMAVVTSPPDSFYVAGVGVAETTVLPRVSSGARPNPFTDRVTLVAPAGCTRVAVRDCCGRLVRMLATAGSRRVSWDGRDAAGHPVPPGIYYCRTLGERHERLRLVRLPR